MQGDEALITNANSLFANTLEGNRALRVRVRTRYILASLSRASRRGCASICTRHFGIQTRAATLEIEGSGAITQLKRPPAVRRIRQARNETQRTRRWLWIL